jgi:hypothetical protein
MWRASRRAARAAQRVGAQFFFCGLCAFVRVLRAKFFLLGLMRGAGEHLFAGADFFGLGKRVE